MTLIEKMRAKLPEKYVEAAIANTPTTDQISLYNERADFSGLFLWEETAEGHAFWAKVHEYLTYDKPLPPFPHHRSKQLSEHSAPETAHVGTNQQTNNNTMFEKYVDKGFVSVDLVDGRDVSDLSDADLISKIKSRQKAVKDLTDTGLTGPYFDQQKAKHDEVVAKLLAALNGRAAAPAAPAQA